MSPRLVVREYASAVVAKVLKDTPKPVTSAGNVSVTMSLERNASPPSGLFVRPRPLGGEMVAPPAVTTKSAVESLRLVHDPVHQRSIENHGTRHELVPAFSRRHVPSNCRSNASLLPKTIRSAVASPARPRANMLRMASLLAVRRTSAWFPSLSFPSTSPRHCARIALPWTSSGSNSPLTDRICDCIVERGGKEA